MIYQQGETEHGPAQFLTFDSGEDFAATLKAMPVTDTDKETCAAFRIDLDTANRHAATGRPDLVEASDSFLSKVEALIDFASSGFETVTTMCGGAPVVPAMLAGQPMHMRSRRATVTDRNSVAIFADAWVQFGVDREYIERRGAAALALVRLLSMQRPVKLYVTCGHGLKNPIIWTLPIETAPLDLQRAAWGLCSEDVLRIHGHRLLHKYVPGDCGWKAHDKPEWQANDMPRLIASRLGVADFVSLPGLTGGDIDDYWKDDDKAVGWIKSQINRWTVDDAA